MSLKDKVAVVTGSAKGIGRAVCVQLAKDGAAVAVWDVDGDGAADTADTIGKEIPVQPELRELMDKQAISELIYSYAQGIDRRDHALLAKVFTPDAMLHAGTYEGPASSLVANWRVGQPSPFLMTHHLVGNILIRLHSEDRARAITYLYALHRVNRDGRLMDEMIRARYLDRLVKHDGQWRFAERTLVYDWSRVALADTTNWWEQPGATALTGAHGAADPATGFLSANEP